VPEITQFGNILPKISVFVCFTFLLLTLPPELLYCVKSSAFEPIHMRVTILHLDLGIGGAEQLIVNVATVAKELGHDVLLLTSHHDPRHCFEETKPNGEVD
jgi:hypothetical protein